MVKPYLGFVTPVLLKSCRYSFLITLLCCSISLKDVHRSAESMSEFTDHVYYDILYSRDPKLAEARTILQRVLSRKLYKFVGKVPLKVPKENRQVGSGFINNVTT